jgi:hypothetical protein
LVDSEWSQSFVLNLGAKQSKAKRNHKAKASIIIIIIISTTTTNNNNLQEHTEKERKETPTSGEEGKQTSIITAATDQ